MRGAMRGYTKCLLFQCLLYLGCVVAALRLVFDLVLDRLRSHANGAHVRWFEGMLVRGYVLPFLRAVSRAAP